MPDLITDDQRDLVSEVREALATWWAGKPHQRPASKAVFAALSGE